MKLLQIGAVIVFLSVVVAISGCTIFAENVKVVVNYNGSWNGTIENSSGSSIISGTGDKTIDQGGLTGDLKVKVQKNDNGTGDLTVNIIRGNKSVENRTTTALDGMVILSIYLAA